MKSQKDTKSQVTDNQKVKSTISRAEGIQQREQLRQMVLNKFINDLAKNSKKKQDIIAQEVDAFFKTQKITESSLKELKSRVYQAVTGKTPSQLGSQNGSQRGEGSQRGDQDNKSVKSQVSHGSQRQQQGQQQNQDTQSQKSQKSRQEDEYSYASSKPPNSVYYLEGDEEDEWATLVKFDTELFKKEQELEKIRQAEFKKKMKNELDRQLNEKSRRQNEDKQEEEAYVDLQVQQLNAFDRREQQKNLERQKKIDNEKRQRDKQVRDENHRKKMERKREKELDEMLVQRIKEEKQMEEDEQQKKRQREKSRLLEMMRENEEYKCVADQEAREERENDIRLQQEYIRLQEELEATREAEKKQREEKIKRIMSAFADSVVKEQKDIIKQEDQKMLQHILDQNDREKQEDIQKQIDLKKQRAQMREFLRRQMEERGVKKVQEQELDKMQAEIWSKDRNNFLEHESEKQAYINMVNKKHQQILVEQMVERDSKKKGKKMNTTELLQNKEKLREIAENNPEAAEKLRKVNV